MLEGNNRITLNHKKLKDAHWDYAQTVTGYSIQSSSQKHVIDFEVSYREHLANQRSFYIGISRAVEHITIYTDNKERFLKRIENNPGDKYAALEVTGEFKKPAARSFTKVSGDRHTEVAKQQDIKIPPVFCDVNEIAKLATGSAEVLVERLLGKPNPKLSNAAAWRYGNKGSLVISMTNDKRGLWHNFETGESGNLLNLIQKNIGLSFRETLEYVSSTLGHVAATNLSLRQAFPQEKQNSAKQEVLHDKTNILTTDIKTYREDKKQKDYAQKLAHESKSINGSLVEQYLKKRGINDMDSGDIRYHPRVYAGKEEKQNYFPAMLALGRDKEGQVQAVQATYLDPKTADKAEVAVKKRTYGSLADAVVSLERNVPGCAKKDTVSFIAEGVETGLSIKEAAKEIKKSEVLVTLGKSNFTHIDPERVGATVVLCLDNDGPNTFFDKTLHQAAERLINAGKEVFIAFPQLSNAKNNKTDFNDVARTAGISAVKNILNNSVPYGEWKANPPNLDNYAKFLKVLTSSFMEHISPKDHEISSGIYDSLFKKTGFNLDAATKLIELEQKSSVAERMITYSQAANELDFRDKPKSQSDLIIRASDLGTNATQKSLVNADLAKANGREI